jgi:branched-chain amino acid transport system ATP-binding protein
MILEVAGLTVRYGNATAVDNIDLTVGDGEMVALVGPNGAGKTSLVNAVAGIITPAAGTVTLNGRYGLVPEGRQMFPDLTVDDNLQLGGWRTKKRDTAWVYELLPELVRVRTQTAGTLSGGQQQMVAFGRALMGDPDLLVVDELSLGLAPLVTADLAGHLTRVNAERGLAVLLIEQNARLAFDLCSRAYVLEAGRVTVEGTCAELADSADVAEAYLGVSGG